VESARKYEQDTCRLREPIYDKLFNESRCSGKARGRAWIRALSSLGCFRAFVGIRMMIMMTTTVCKCARFEDSQCIIDDDKHPRRVSSRSDRQKDFVFRYCVRRIAKFSRTVRKDTHAHRHSAYTHALRNSPLSGFLAFCDSA